MYDYVLILIVYHEKIFLKFEKMLGMRMNVICILH